MQYRQYTQLKCDSILQVKSASFSLFVFKIPLESILLLRMFTWYHTNEQIIPDPEPFLAIPHPTELRCTLLRYPPPPHWAMLQPI